MKTFREIICLCGILIFILTLCSADDGLSEAKLKEIYKLGTAKGDTIDAINYKIIKGEITMEPTKKIWMKIENSVSNKKTGPLHKISMSKKTENPKPYILHEIAVFQDLKKEKKDLLRECVVDMLNHGTYDKKKVLIIPGLGKNLKEYSSKPYSWMELSKMGPCMIKALRLLHERGYVHRNLNLEVFAFGTEEKVAPLKNQVYLFDVGLAEKYTDSKGKHKKTEDIKKFVGNMTFASRAAMNNMTQCRRDDIESLFFVLTYIAGFTSPFQEYDFRDLFNAKHRLSTDLSTIRSVFQKSENTDVRVLNAFMDYSYDMRALFKSNGQPEYEMEPEYDDFTKCFDQGKSEKDIKTKYRFVDIKNFEQKGCSSLIGPGNTTDSNNKTEVVMKLMKTSRDKNMENGNYLSFTDELRVYKDLKKGLKHSLLRENVCEMLDFGVYDNCRAIIMPRLGLDWYDALQERSQNGYTYEELSSLARQAISALRFVHKRGYIHRDLKLENFAFGSVEVNKSDKSQLDKPLKTRLYLYDFGVAAKWYVKNKHIPRVKITSLIGSEVYASRTALATCSQSRRDDMESLGYTFAVAAAGTYIFKKNLEQHSMPSVFKEKNDFLMKPGQISKVFDGVGISDQRIHEAFKNYVAELNKLFVNDKPAYFEKEPDYNAFCACFGGKGDNACVVE